MSDAPFDLAGPGARPRPAAEAAHQARPRTAVVLAAGRSNRLKDVTGGGSKALVRIGGIPLVERAVRMLLAAGLEEIVVVVGYHAGPVAAVVDRLAPGRVRTVYAERWADGNGASLAAAEPFVRGERLFAVVTADHVFEADALRPLLAAARPAVLVDPRPNADAWAEGTRVRIDDDRAVAFSKALDDPAIDCGAFVLPQEAFDAQRRAAARGDASLAEAVSELAATCPLAAISLADGERWQDVDTPDDLARARALVRRSLAGNADGPVARHLNRPLSTRLSMLLSPLRVHPDIVSAAALALALVAAALLASGQGIWGALCVQASSIIDGSDGELARLQFRAGPAGALLDGILDRLADVAIVIGLGLWALDAGLAADDAVALTCVAAAGSVLSMASKDRIAALGLANRHERGIGLLMAGRDGRLLIVAVASLFAAPTAGLVAVAVTSAAALTARVVLTLSARRRVRSS